MSASDKIEYGSISGIFDKEIKGKIDAPWRFQRQLERCNVLMAGADLQSFESSVRALLGDLPFDIKSNVLARKNEFNPTPQPTYHYIENCNIKVGTPDNQLISVVGHEEWEFMNEVPKHFLDNHMDKITILSPVEVEGVQFTDHEKLLEIIKEEADRGGLGWRYENTRLEVGPVEKILPDGLSRDLENVLIDQLIKHRQEGHMYSWAEMIGVMQSRTPNTPTLPKEEEEPEATETVTETPPPEIIEEENIEPEEGETPIEGDTEKLLTGIFEPEESE